MLLSMLNAAPCLDQELGSKMSNLKALSIALGIEPYSERERERGGGGGGGGERQAHKNR